jgi:23S rRNA (guanine745-N1)-methyltransferase
MMTQFLCPLCNGSLQRIDSSWQCEQGHNFDIARQGYCNLLPVQNKKSRSPGDDKAMVNARNRFLLQDYYQPLSTQLNQQVIDYIQSQNLDDVSIVDAGCGEGYYTARMHEALNSVGKTCQITGVDISKFAVQAAAKRHKNIDWFVASSSHLPVSDQSCDVVSCLFAPIAANEFRRVVRDGGLLIVVSTGKNHLIELREKLYEKVNDDVLDPVKALAEKFEFVGVELKRYEVTLEDQQSISDLLLMTPHYWRSSPEKKLQLQELTELKLTIDVNLHSFSPL